MIDFYLKTVFIIKKKHSFIQTIKRYIDKEMKFMLNIYISPR